LIFFTFILSLQEELSIQNLRGQVLLDKSFEL